MKNIKKIVFSGVALLTFGIGTAYINIPNTNMRNIIVEAAVVGDDYPAKWKSLPLGGTYDSWGMATRYCTSFVANRLSASNNFNINRGGMDWNAINWGPNAQRQGFRVDKNPAVGSVAWWGAGYHVAWVAEVKGDNVLIEEYNWDYKGNYHSRWINKLAVDGYIHFKDISTPSPVPKPMQPSIYKVGQEVQIKNSAVAESNGYDLKPRRNWIGKVTTVRVDNKFSSKYSYRVEYKTGDGTVSNVYVLEQDLQKPLPSKYKAGQEVQIRNSAVAESNGYDLKPRRNWIGKITTVRADNKFSSNYSYRVEYKSGDGTVSNVYVLEQDLQNPLPSKYKVGQEVQIKNSAVAESNGYDLKPRRNWIGKVTTVRADNKFSSNYSYRVEYKTGDGTVSNVYVLEQDLQNPLPSKYKVGQEVQIKNSAVAESNGYDLKPRRNWIGKVTTVRADNKFSSNYSYRVEYKTGDGTVSNVYVLEQDLQNPLPSKYKVGQEVQIKTSAVAESNGYDLKPRHNWIGKITTVRVDNKFSSNYSYRVEYKTGDGTVSNVYVLEQDLQNPLPSKYKVGQEVQIKSTAGTETNGTGLTNRRNWIGKITKVQVDNKWSSHYSYRVEYKSGNQTISNWYVSEQDIVSVNASKYKVGQTIQIKNSAVAESNGTNIVAHRGWVGKILEVHIDNKYSSHYSYKVEYLNKTSNWYVLEQDLDPHAAVASRAATARITIPKAIESESESSENKEDKSKFAVTNDSKKPEDDGLDTTTSNTTSQTTESKVSESTESSIGDKNQTSDSTSTSEDVTPQTQSTEESAKSTSQVEEKKINLPSDYQVNVDEVSVFTNADVNSQEKAKLKRGQIITVLQLFQGDNSPKNGWAQFKLEDGSMAYISLDNLLKK
ncbi:CHAP domain-containing protein [Floricoccus penangensis]|uniref:CHAP domain-containing protein n=1 Tax=Floricoccus penangensis TaxID=1859475 RepID=UPI00203BAE15|nr:CHAP domain-containing protein [Floricoccus penangensis]URZ87631.1 CHAP domain-containing protein [Floricoccus penangensis]